MKLVHRVRHFMPGLWPLVKETFVGWWEDKAPRLGASLAYYTVLALAPVVILLTPMVSVIFGPKIAAPAIEQQFLELVGEQGAAAVRAVLESPGFAAGPSRLVRIISLAVLLFAASGVFVELQDALDTIWEVAPKPGRRAFWALLRKRFLSFAMVLGICFLLLVSLIISAGLAALRAYAGSEFQGMALVWTVAHDVVSFAVVMLLFATIYKVLPDVTIRWRDVWVGAALTAVLFSLGRFLIGNYIGRASVGRYYGAAGSLVALLVWVYYSAQIL